MDWRQPSHLRPHLTARLLPGNAQPRGCLKTAAWSWLRLLVSRQRLGSGACLPMAAYLPSTISSIHREEALKRSACLPKSSLFALLALLVLLTYPCLAQDNYEIQVYPSETIAR